MTGTAGYRDLYPRAYIAPAHNGKFWVTLCADADTEIAQALVHAGDANRLARTWEKETLARTDLTCPECFGEGDVECTDCHGEGRAAIGMTWDGDQIISDCPKRERCGHCRGQGATDPGAM